MLDLLAGFVTELRRSGLPVSLTEHLDAAEAVKHIPLEDREALKYALAATLVKSSSHWRAFETAFEVFFAVRTGGGTEAVAKHRRRNKLTARERVERLIDPGSDFLELSALAAFGMYNNDSPAAGIVTGIGIVEGQHCAIVANDATVKGGTYYPMTVK